MLLLGKPLIMSAFLVCNLSVFNGLPAGLPISLTLSILLLTTCIFLLKSTSFLLLIGKLFHSSKWPIKPKHFLLTLLLTVLGPIALIVNG